MSTIGPELAETLTHISTSTLIGAIAAGLATLIYIFLTWNFNYWQKQGVKCARPWPFWGTVSNIFSKPLDIQDTENYKKFGRIYGVYEGRSPALFVAEPDILKSILIKDFHKFQNRREVELSKRDNVVKNFLSLLRDEEWRHHRNIITPTFTTGKMKQMLILIEECAQELVLHLRKQEEKNEPVEFTRCLVGFTLDVIATCAFGTKIDCLNNPESEFVKMSIAGFTNPSKLLILGTMFPKLIKYLPPFVPQKTIDYYSNLVNSVIEARKKETNPRKDFLQIMLDAKEECEKGISVDGHSLNSKYPLTHDHVIAQSIMFIFAGFATTSTTLSFALYNLVLYEEVQEKLIKEIDDVLAKNNGKLNYELVGEMQYLDMVISETLRLYPPTARLERSCSQDYEIKNIKLKKGMVVSVPIYCMHHDEEFYPEPEKFDPERFSDGHRNKDFYYPFGAGPRHCVGMRFALMEMKIALAYMLKEFRIKKCSATDIPFVRKQKARSIRPERMNLMLEKRNDVTF